jgi:tetratricopeptide (TPR) repeat protein
MTPDGNFVFLVLVLQYQFPPHLKDESIHEAIGSAETTSRQRGNIQLNNILKKVEFRNVSGVTGMGNVSKAISSHPRRAAWNKARRLCTCKRGRWPVSWFLFWNERESKIHICSFKQKGDLAKASAILDQRFKFNPRRHQEQEESLLIKLEQYPDSLKFTTKLARNYFIRGIFRTAESLLRRAVQISGNDALVLSNLGYFLLQTGGEVEADAILNQAVRQDEHCALAWTNLGELEYMRQIRAGSISRPRVPMEKAVRQRCVAEHHHRRAIQEDPRWACRTAGSRMGAVKQSGSG